MSPHGRRQFIGYILIFFTVLLPVLVTYSLSFSTSREHTLDEVNVNNTASHTSLSSISNGDIFLVKNNKLEIGKTCLDFKGLNKKSILVDLYLLDLDDEQPYTQKISRKKVGKEIRLGDHTYKVVVAKDRYLKLKIINIFSTP